MYFVNCSNHPWVNWSEAQRKAAQQWGDIVDYPFPQVPSDCTEEEVHALAQRVFSDVLTLDPAAVMCQGEFTLTFAVVSMLKEHGIPVVAACSERRVIERTLEDGRTEKTACFEFVRFRRY